MGSIYGFAFACSHFEPKVKMPMIFFCASIGIDLAIAAQRTHVGVTDAYAFDPLCVMLVVETVKFLWSGLMCYQSRKEQEATPCAKLTSSDVFYFGTPAAMYTMANLLTYWAMGTNDMSVFLLFRDSMVIWTTLAWWYVFGTKPGPMCLASIAIITFGLLLNRIGSFYEGAPWSWSFLWVILMTLCVAGGSVSFEYALKRNASIDIHTQNTLMFGLCATFSFLMLCVMDPVRLSGPTSFFRGFNSWTALTCCLSIIAGIAAAYLLKYTDAVFKMVATTLRGPLLLFLATATPLLSAQVDVTTVIPAAIVVGGCVNYLAHGTMKASEPAVQKANSLKV